MSYKDKLTRLLLDCAFKCPFLFPKHFRYLAKKYHSNSEYINKKKAAEQKYKEVSLFDSDFYWKAISFTIIVNNDELDSIKKWKEKASLNNFAEHSRKMLESGSFDRGTGWANIGVVRVDNETFMDDLNSIYI